MSLFKRCFKEDEISLPHKSKTRKIYRLYLAPFGYMKNPDDTYSLMIDEETSWIVEKIYDLAISGYGVQAIRRILFDEKFLRLLGGIGKRDLEMSLPN